MGRVVSCDLVITRGLARFGREIRGCSHTKMWCLFTLCVMTGADNQLITVHVRVRQVSADLGYINIDICRDIGKVSVYGRWSLIREVVEGRFDCRW